MKTAINIMYEGVFMLACHIANTKVGRGQCAVDKAKWAVVYDRAYNQKLAEVKMRFTFDRIGLKQ